MESAKHVTGDGSGKPTSYEALSRLHNLSKERNALPEGDVRREDIEKQSDEWRRKARNLFRPMNPSAESLKPREGEIVRQYADYFSFLVNRNEGQDTTAVQREFEGFDEMLRSDNVSEVPIPYLQALHREHPLLAVTATHLLLEAESHESRLKRPTKVWFVEALKLASMAREKSDLFFENWEHALPKQDTLSMAFLKDFNSEIQTFLAACVNMACCFAAHAQQEDCAVYTIDTPFNSPPEGFERSSLQRKMRALLQSDLYATYSAKLLPSNGMASGIVRIPTYVSVVDVVDFLEFLRDFFVQLPQALQQRASNHHQRSYAEITSHPTEKKGVHQARFALGMRGDTFEGFNIRVDRDRSRLTMDIGGIERAQALAYANEVAEEAREREMVMKYSQIVGQDGSLANVRDKRSHMQIGMQEPYVSVMRSTILEPGERAALFAAAAMEVGMGTIFANGEHFSYHQRGRLNQEEYLKHFPSIVTAITTALRLSASVGR